MKKILLLLILLTPIFCSAQVEIIGKKKKFVATVKEKAQLIIDTPEMSVWDNKGEGSSLYLICYYKEEECIKTLSVYPAEKMGQWERILALNCAKVKGSENLWLDQKRNLFFKILPGTNGTFALESTKSNE